MDLFGGVGGFRLGLERAWVHRRSVSRPRRNQPDAPSEESQRQPSGRSHSRGSLACVGYYELDKYAVKIYNKNFREDWQPTDVRRLRARQIPAFDLLCAGFPCQSFSLAGNREGFEDTRGTLFFEIARIAKERQPSLLLLENVFGLISHDEGRTFETILRVLDEVGYDAEWQVLNSKHFGVPQNRERVFIVGHLRGKPFREVFPLREDGNASPRGTEEPEATVLRTFTAGAHSGGLHSAMTAIVDLSHRFNDGPRFYRNETPALSTPGGGWHIPHVANTITDGWLMDTSHHSEPMNRYRIRRLTPLECERLQGFPDDWTSGVSDTQRYKMMGNAVTVNVIEAIGKELVRI